LYRKNPENSRFAVSAQKTLHQVQTNNKV